MVRLETNKGQTSPNGRQVVVVQQGLPLDFLFDAIVRLALLVYLTSIYIKYRRTTMKNGIAFHLYYWPLLAYCVGNRIVCIATDGMEEGFELPLSRWVDDPTNELYYTLGRHEWVCAFDLIFLCACFISVMADAFIFKPSMDYYEDQYDVREYKILRKQAKKEQLMSQVQALKGKGKSPQEIKEIMGSALSGGKGNYGAAASSSSQGKGGKPAAPAAIETLNAQPIPYSPNADA